MLTTYEQQSRRKLAATVIAIVIVAGVVLFVDHLKAADATAANTGTQTSRVTAAPSSTSADTSGGAASSSSSSASTGTYKDGRYSASSSYYVPGGNESIQVSLSLKNGTITGASIQNSESDRDSQMFQEDFASAYKSYVVGKKITGLQLGVVAGASDTTQGFNEALSHIAAEAQG